MSCDWKQKLNTDVLFVNGALLGRDIIIVYGTIALGSDFDFLGNRFQKNSPILYGTTVTVLLA